MKASSVLRWCREMGYPISRARLYIAGEKYGFTTKTEGVPALEFNKDKFMEWFKGVMKTIPEGYIPIKDYHTKHPEDGSLVSIYSYAKAKEVDKIRVGTGKGIIYVNEEQLERYIRKYKDGDFEGLNG